MKPDRYIAGILIALCLLSSVTLIFQQKSSAVKGKKAEGVFDWNDGFNLKKADIAVLDLSGPIMYGSSSGFGRDSGVDANELVPVLEQIKKDKVKGIILRLNSPGGTAAASQAIYEKIQSIKKSDKIKVYSFMQDVAASGAYYIASASDKIYANPSTLTGSIGVIMQIPNYTELGNKIGIQTNTIKSGKYKDLGNASRKMTEDEKKLLQDLINDTYEEFAKAVSFGRNLPLERVKELGDGRIYTGNQALKNNLVDKLGTEYQLVEDITKDLKIDGKAKLKNYTKSGWEKIFDGIGAKSSLSSLDALVNSTELSTKFNKIPLMLYK